MIQDTRPDLLNIDRAMELASTVVDDSVLAIAKLLLMVQSKSLAIGRNELGAGMFHVPGPSAKV